MMLPWRRQARVGCIFLALMCLTCIYPGQAKAKAQNDKWAEAMRHYSLSEKFLKEDKFSQALPHAQKVVALVGEVKGDKDPQYAAALTNLASLYRDLKEYALAEPLYKRALAIEEKALGPNNPALGSTLNNMAGLYQQMGDFLRAEPLFKQALAIQEKALGQNHPTVATTLNNLGRLYFDKRAYAQAEPLFKRSLAIREKVLGTNHPSTVTVRKNLAAAQRRRAEAALMERQTAPSNGKDVPSQELQRQFLIYKSLVKVGKHRQALPHAQKMVTLMGEEQGQSSLTYAVSLLGLANLYREIAEFAKAEPLYKHSLNILQSAKGDNQNALAAVLSDMGEMYYKMGAYVQAEPLFKRSLKIEEKSRGPNHPLVATTLNNMGLLYLDMGAYAKAEPLFKRSLAISEKALGPKDPSVVSTRENLALLQQQRRLHAAKAIGQGASTPAQNAKWQEAKRLLHTYLSLSEAGKKRQALPLAQKVVVLVGEAKGESDPEYAASLGLLANLYKVMKDYAQAESLLKQALAIDEKALGPDSTQVATTLINLAGLYTEMGAYAKADPLYRQALAIRETALGPNHPQVAVALNYLARNYQDTGTYAKAEPLLKRALAIDEKALKTNPLPAATTMNNLGELYSWLDAYSLAEPLLKQALAIREKALGRNHTLVALTLNNLAGLYLKMGAFTNAEPLFKRALSIDEKALGPNHPQVANTLNNLAGRYLEVQAYAKAEPLLKRSLAIAEKSQGLNNPSVTFPMNNLAGLYLRMGDYAEAESLFKRSLAIREKTMGAHHLSVAKNLNNLGVLYQTKGDYVQAYTFFKRALAINENAFGPDYSQVALNLHNLADIFAAQNDPKKAHSLFMRAQRIEQKQIDIVAGGFSEKRTLAFLESKRGPLWSLLSLTSKQLINNTNARKNTFGIWLRRKGITLEVRKRYQEALLYSGDPKAMEVFSELSSVRSELARLSFSGPGKQKPEDYRARIAKLEKQKDELEARLARLSQAYAKTLMVRRATVDEVAGALPLGSVLVDFAKIRHFNFKAKGKEKRWLPSHYLAFVLSARKPGAVHLLDLGPAKAIDVSIAKFKKGTKGKWDPSLATRLYDLVFKPLEKEIGQAKIIFVSPDGQLNLIPFEIMRDDSGRFLIQRFAFNYLGTSRDLVGFSAVRIKSNPPLLIGAPDFDLTSSEKAGTLSRMGMHKAGSLQPVMRSGDIKVMRFQRLPGTKQEIKAIQALLGKAACEVYTGPQALEEVLLAKPSPRILHLATHGFFLRYQAPDKSGELRGVGGQVTALGLPLPGTGVLASSMTVLAPSPGVMIEDPLLRSGLALAGANCANTTANGSDGLFSAEEILGLRLQGTELVVLSACQTGLGQVQTGEGVFGLRRAFTLVGAESLVMSMWNVPDRETKELMTAFYKNILKKRMDRRSALRQAALKQLELTKQRTGNANPYYWGAFVFLGKAN